MAIVSTVNETPETVEALAGQVTQVLENAEQAVNDALEDDDKKQANDIQRQMTALEDKLKCLTDKMEALEAKNLSSQKLTLPELPEEMTGLLKSVQNGLAALNTRLSRRSQTQQNLSSQKPPQEKEAARAAPQTRRGIRML